MERSRIIHDLRLRASFFEFVEQGIKKFEVLPDDRDYKRGDLIRFHDFCREELTGNTILKRIVYILRKGKGLMQGYLVIGFTDYE